MSSGWHLFLSSMLATIICFVCMHKQKMIQAKWLCNVFFFCSLYSPLSLAISFLLSVHTPTQDEEFIEWWAMQRGLRFFRLNHIVISSSFSFSTTWIGLQKNFLLFSLLFLWISTLLFLYAEHASKNKWVEETSVQRMGKYPSSYFLFADFVGLTPCIFLFFDLCPF